MKKTISIIAGLFMATAIFAQSDKYVKAMEGLMPAVDSTRSEEGLIALANSFERIANAEKTQWLPYYYVALCQVNIANGYFQTQQPEKIDPILDKAEASLKKAGEMAANNSEVLLLKKMFNSARMMADPMNRYMTYGTAATEALEKAKTVDPGNPRVYLMEGIDKFYTPEQFGGSKTEGKKLFEEAAKKFESFKPASTIHPGWGQGTTQYFLAEASK